MAFWPNSKKSDYEEARSAENSNTDSDGSPLTAQSSSSTTDTEAINADISGDDLDWEDSDDTVSPGMDESEIEEMRRKFLNGGDTDLDIFDPEDDVLNSSDIGVPTSQAVSETEDNAVDSMLGDVGSTSTVNCSKTGLGETKSKSGFTTIVVKLDKLETAS